jgi:glycosyltransferase involved in cell wall biosynthesis
LLFADRTVVLSEHTRRRFVSAGVPAEQLAVIPPGIEPLNPLGAEAKRIVRESFGIPTDHSIVLYPGDLEFGGGAQVVTRLVADLPAATSLVMACRAKTALAVQAEQELKAGLRERGLEDRVFWIGETPKIHDLVSAADIVVLPTESLFAKMDYPLVLLEAMSAGVPVVVSEGTAAAELAQYGAVVCPCESTALLDALSGLIDDPSERTHRGLKGAEAVRNVFGRAALASAYERLYDDILR